MHAPVAPGAERPGSTSLGNPGRSRVAVNWLHRQAAATVVVVVAGSVVVVATGAAAAAEV